MAGVTIAATTTPIPTTSLITTTPLPECPSAYELTVYEYSTKDFFTIEYPVDGYRVLRGSNEVLMIPPNEPQEILLVRENVVFMDLRFSVRYAKSATLRLTRSDQQTTNVQHPAAVDAVG